MNSMRDWRHRPNDHLSWSVADTTQAVALLFATYLLTPEVNPRRAVTLPTPPRDTSPGSRARHGQSRLRAGVPRREELERDRVYNPVVNATRPSYVLSAGMYSLYEAGCPAPTTQSCMSAASRHSSRSRFAQGTPLVPFLPPTEITEQHTSVSVLSPRVEEASKRPSLLPPYRLVNGSCFSGFESSKRSRGSKHRPVFTASTSDTLTVPWLPSRLLLAIFRVWTWWLRVSSPALALRRFPDRHWNLPRRLTNFFAPKRSQLSRTLSPLHPCHHVRSPPVGSKARHRDG